MHECILYKKIRVMLSWQHEFLEKMTGFHGKYCLNLKCARSQISHDIFTILVSKRMHWGMPID